MSTSPPTERVVDVIETLVQATRPLTVPEISNRLNLNRSTCRAILSTLEARNWVERITEHGFQPGPALIPLVAKVEERLSDLQQAAALVRDLSAACGHIATLTRYTPTRAFTVILVDGRDPDRMPHNPMMSFPIMPPLGAATAAYAPADELDAWLAKMPDRESRRSVEQLQATVRATGFVIWRLQQPPGDLAGWLELIQQVAPPLAVPSESPARVSALLGAFGLLAPPFAYTTEQLAVDAPLDVSYVTAPVVPPSGARPKYEIVVNVRQAGVQKPERERIASLVRAAAAELAERMPVPD